MHNITTIGLDLAKSVFQVHGMDHEGQAVLRKKLRRRQVLKFFGTIPPCLVGMEACGRAHGIVNLTCCNQNGTHSWGSDTASTYTCHMVCL